eukprot:COSAG04_NODE_1865_length_5359_cov_3.964449_9_plen_71_part_00
MLEDSARMRVQHRLEPRLRRQRPGALEAARDGALGGAGAQLAVETARLQQLCGHAGTSATDCQPDVTRSV